MTEEEQEIKYLKNRIDELERKQYKKLSAIESDVAEIKNGLFGNERMGTKGLVQKVEENQEYIASDRKLKNKVGGVMALLTFLLGAFGYFINQLLTKLLK